MRRMLAVMAVVTTLAVGPAAAWAGLAVVGTPAAESPSAGSVFADLAALGYDLDKFRPDYAGRFPYR